MAEGHLDNSSIMKKLYWAIFALLSLYVGICTLLYFFQEKLLFFPEKLNKDYKFDFNQSFEEITIKTKDGVSLNGLLFKSDSAKGVIFYLHGNAGSLRSWGEVARTYTDLHYDIFILDYRGFGKSEGAINNERTLYQDVQTAYDEIKKRYTESNMIVLGYSIGTGPAAKIASTNNPKLLILQAPYFSMIDLLKNTYPILPVFILKYKLETNRFIKDCKIPITIFHGDMDEVIYYGSSVKLKEIMKGSDTLITLHGQGHNGMTDNNDYKLSLRNILSK